MKTDKYTNMIGAIEADFTLARDNLFDMSILSRHIQNGNKRILHDIDLLEELYWGLRYGTIEIHIVDEQ